MKSIIKDLQSVVEDLEYGVITKNDVVSKMESVISELEILENEKS